VNVQNRQKDGTFISVRPTVRFCR